MNYSQMDIKTIVEQFKEEDDEKYTPPNGEDRLLTSNQEPPPAKTNIPVIPKPKTTHSPEEGKYAFNLVSVIGLAGEPSTFNMDVLLGATFLANKGVTEINVNGDAYFMTPIRQRESDPKVKISVKNKISFPPSGGYVYQGNMDVFVNLDYNIVSIKGAQSNNNKMVSACMQFGSASDEDWYLYVGNPYDIALPLNPQNDELTMQPGRGSLKVKTPLSAITADGYFLLGNRLPTYLPEIDQDIKAMIGDVTVGGKNSLSGDVKSDIGQRNRMGSGIGFGTTIGFKSANKFAIIGYDLTVKAGFDFLLTNNIGTCSGYPDPGFNGWYGNGQVFAGFNGRIYVINYLPFGPDEINILSATAVAEVVGGGPNPWWVRGGAGVSYEVLGGMIEGEDYFEFALGDVCIPETEDPFGMDVIASITPNNASKDISPFVSPVIDFNIPMEKTYDFQEMYENDINQLKLKTVKLKPTITNLELKNGVGKIDLSQAWSNGNTTFTLHPSISLPLDNTITLKATIKAECISGCTFQSGAYWKKNSNSPVWQKDTLITFKIADKVDNANEIVTLTLPIHGRRYEYPTTYTQGNFGLQLSQVIGLDILKPEEKTGVWTYSYKADIIDPVQNKIINTVPFTLASDRRSISFDKFELEPNKKYMVRLARKQTWVTLTPNGPNLNPGAQSALDRINNSVYNYAGLDNLSSIDNHEVKRIISTMSGRKRRTTFNRSAIAEDSDSGSFDKITDKVQQEIATYFFETSGYYSFEEKMADAEVKMIQKRSGFTGLEIKLKEPLDIIEAGSGLEEIRKRFKSYSETLLAQYIPLWEHKTDMPFFKEFNKQYFKNPKGVDAQMMEQTIKAFNTIEMRPIDYTWRGQLRENQEGELRKNGNYPNYKALVFATLSNSFTIPRLEVGEFFDGPEWNKIDNRLTGSLTPIHDLTSISTAPFGSGLNVNQTSGSYSPTGNNINLNPGNTNPFMNSGSSGSSPATFTYRLAFDPKDEAKDKYEKVKTYISNIRYFDLVNFQVSPIIKITDTGRILDNFFKDKLNTSQYTSYRNTTLSNSFFDQQYIRPNWNFDFRSRIPIDRGNIHNSTVTY